MARVVLTVGMSTWPFDRLVRAVAGLCTEYDVFAQIGPSAAPPPCPHAPFVPLAELVPLLRDADVVVTHAGNTVRLVQRMDKVPVAVAREAARGEAANDHQVTYLRREERCGRVVPVWDTGRLAAAVGGHQAAQDRLLRERPLPPEPDPRRLRAIMDELCSRLVRDARR